MSARHQQQTAPIPIPAFGVLKIPAPLPKNAVAVRGAANFSTGPSGGGGTVKTSYPSARPVEGWVYENPDGTLERPPANLPPAVAASEGRWWLWFWIFMGILFLLFFVSILFWPVHGEGHHHGDEWHGKSMPPDAPPPAVDRTDKPEDCTNDEVYSDEAKMCIMRSYFPRAVSSVIMDPSVSPCTDIYRHACGKWLDTHTNENRGFAGLSALNGVAIGRIIMNKSIANLNPFYLSFEATFVKQEGAHFARQREAALMDSKLTREAILGRMLDPLVSHADLPIVFARMTAAGYTVPVAFAIQGNPLDKGVIPMWMYDGFQGREHDPEWVRMHFEALYGEGSEQAAYEANLFVNMVARIDVHEPDKDRDLETYEGWKTYVTSGHARTDMMPWNVFKGLSKSIFDWNIFLGELQKRLSLREFNLADDQTVWAFSRPYFEWFMPELFSVSEWRTYLTFSVLYHTHDFFPELPSDVLLSGKPINVVSPLKDMHKRLKKRPLSSSLYGAKTATGQKPVWKKVGRRLSSKDAKYTKGRVRSNEEDEQGLVVTGAECIAATKYMLPGILSKEFLATKFKDAEQTRQRVQTMVEKIRDRFVFNLERTEWLDEKTRAAQVEKVKAIVPRVVHPTQWSEETFPLGKEMDPVRYLRNLAIVQEERIRRNLALWSETNYGSHCDDRCRDRITAFGSPLFTVNAWYNPDRNVITIPAGILQPPFYHPQYTDASAYGTIGAVVGHELSHSQDANGVLYDKDGVMRTTWSDAAMAQYRKRVSCLVQEYNTLEDCKVDAYGEQTLSENVADNNGLRIAYEALFEDPATRHLYTQEDKKEFLLANAQIWCASYSPQVLCESARDDVHAAALLRVRKTFAQLPYYADVMHCAVGEPMHRHAKERCELFGPEA